MGEKQGKPGSRERIEGHMVPTDTITNAQSLNADIVQNPSTPSILPVLVIAGINGFLNVVFGVEVGEAGFAGVTDRGELDAILFHPLLGGGFVLETTHEYRVTL